MTESESGFRGLLSGVLASRQSAYRFCGFALGHRCRHGLGEAAVTRHRHYFGLGRDERRA